MHKTPTGIDTFKLAWKSFQQRDVHHKNYVDTFLEFGQLKRDEEPLEAFLKRNEKNVVIPKFFINGTDVTQWLNLNLYCGKILDYPGHMFNALYTYHFGQGEHLPSLKMQLYRLKGYKVNKEKLRNFDFQLDTIDIDWDNFVEEENETVQLYNCPCGDRGCGYFGIDVEKKEETIHWKIDRYIRTFKFDFAKYQKEFKEYETLLQC